MNSIVKIALTVAAGTLAMLATDLLWDRWVDDRAEETESKETS